ncbi:MAG: hypothetical protein AB1921_05465 [Thermodesulfobacteriota bacterium]
MKEKIINVIVLLALIVFFLTFGCASIERKLLFYPSHSPHHGDKLSPWMKDDQAITTTREKIRKAEKTNRLVRERLTTSGQGLPVTVVQVDE